MIKLEVYITNDGKKPFEDWFKSLNVHAANKVNAYLTRVAQGNASNLKPIKGAFQELRIDWGPGYRVYIGKDGNRLIILLGGGTKKQQQKDIEEAEFYWEEYKNKGASYE